MTRWAILTGEYPPQFGGVSDYTRLVAGALAAAGDAVTVYAPRSAGTDPTDPGVTVCRLPDHFGPHGLFALDGALARRPRPTRILVQYVPHAFGCKAMNLPFAAWLATRGRHLAPVSVMFHEVYFPFRWRPAAHAAIGAATRVMARLVAGAAERVFVSTLAWASLLRRVCPRVKPAEWLAVPCNVDAQTEPGAVARVRQEFAAGGRLVGHFGTFGGAVTDLLGPAAGAALRRAPDVRLLLIGRGGEAFRDRFAADHPDLATRAAATGELPADAVAGHLTACDLLLQPFPDGISTRRTTAMAGLAVGVPVVSNLGPLSDPVWAGLEWPGLAPAPAPDDIATALEAVLALPPERCAELGRSGAALYRERFSLENTIRTLRAPAAPVTR